MCFYIALVFFNEKKIEKDSDDFWHRKLTLKVKHWHLSFEYVNSLAIIFLIFYPRFKISWTLIAIMYLYLMWWKSFGKFDNLKSIWWTILYSILWTIQRQFHGQILLTSESLFFSLIIPNTYYLHWSWSRCLESVTE